MEEYTKAQIAAHNTPKDCFIIVHGLGMFKSFSCCPEIYTTNLVQYTM